MRPVVLWLTCLAACGTATTEQGMERTPTEVCLDVANAVATTVQRCGGDYGDAFTSFVDTAVDGSCQNVVFIRDIDELYDVCIPTVEQTSCDVVLDVIDRVPEPCRDQLIFVRE